MAPVIVRSFTYICIYICSICMHECMCTCIYIYMYICVCMYFFIPARVLIHLCP